MSIRSLLLIVAIASAAAAIELSAAAQPLEHAAPPPLVSVDGGAAEPPSDAGPARPAAADAATADVAPDERGTSAADDGAPSGRAAPPTESARGSGALRVGLEAVAQYAYRSFAGPGDDRTWYHDFDVPRVHGAIEGEAEHARGRLVLEATRSASEGALVGVSGDSLVLRVREAYGAYRVVQPLELSAGVVPTLTVPEIDGTWMLRAVAPSGLEANDVLPAADLGGRIRFDAPRDLGFFAIAAYNGEGYNARELNRGKTVEGAAGLHPFAGGALEPLGLFASYVAGSRGTARARADRLTGGLEWQGARVRAGVFVTHAWGVARLGTQRAFVGSAFARLEPIRRLLLGARIDHTIRDAAAGDDAVTTIWGVAGYRLARPLETFLALTRSIPTARAGAELPGSDSWELRAISRVVF